MPPPWSSKEGAKQMVKVSVSYTPTARSCPGDRHCGFPPAEGPAGPIWTILTPHWQVHFQPNEASGCTSPRPGHRSLPQSPSCGSDCSCVSERQSWAGALGKSFLHSIQMVSGCSPQAPPFTYPTRLLRWVHPSQPDWLLCIWSFCYEAMCLA